MRHIWRSLFELLAACGLGNTVIAIYIYLHLSDKDLANPDIGLWLLLPIAIASTILTRWLFSSTSNDRLISGPFMSGVRTTSVVVLLLAFAAFVHLRGTSSSLYETAVTRLGQTDRDVLSDVTRYALYLNAWALSATIALVYGTCMIASALRNGVRRLLA